MQGQTSSTGSGILHLKCKWLVVAVAGKKKGYSLVYELQQMRKMDSWVEIQEKKKKSTKIIENMKAKMKERGSSLKYRISLCFFFPFKWNQFSSLGWQQQDTVRGSRASAYVTTYLQLFLSGTQVSPFDIFWPNSQHNNFLDFIHNYFMKRIVHLQCH